MQYKLGKKPARHGAIKLKFATFFDAKLLAPIVPRVFGHESIGRPWGMLLNDKLSNCVFAGADHEHMAWAHGRGDPIPDFEDAQTVADYSAVTGYDPKRPDTDQGTDMQEAAEYRRTVGVVDAAGVRHKIDSYLELRTGNADDLALATYLTGAVGVGIRFPDSAEKQFDAKQPWETVHGSRASGGHYIPCIGRNSAGNFLIVTWGRLQAMTSEFYERWCDEVVAYVSIEQMRDKITPEGFDAAYLQKSLAALSA